PEIVRTVGIVGHAFAARARVRRHEHDAELVRDALGARLDHEGFLGAGEPGQPGQHRHVAARRMRGNEYRESHLAVVDLGAMLVEADGSAKAGVLAHDLQGHCLTSPFAAAPGSRWFPRIRSCCSSPYAAPHRRYVPSRAAIPRWLLPSRKR